jgi:subtilase family serine protease
VKGFSRLAAPLVVALATTACGASSFSVPFASGDSAASPDRIPQWEEKHEAYRACPGSRVNQMQCDALIESEPGGPIAGWTPHDLESAYKLTSLLKRKGSGEIVAVVDAFDNPNAASDLAEFRSTFHLPPAVFTKYNQAGETKRFPQPNTGWGVEIDLDVEMVSVSCPNCTIDLIEANTNSGSNLYNAVKEAEKLGAHIISTSWGGSTGSESDGPFDATGVTFVASAGDFGYGMQDPADYDTVLSVGGTRLTSSGSPPKYSERVWADTGAGCSDVLKPSWQHDPRCTSRTGNDVAAVAADVAEYDSFNRKGWITTGGTSVSTPLIAGIFGLAGNAGSQKGGEMIWSLARKKRSEALHYVDHGTVAGCPANVRGTYLCTAGTGQYGVYSGPAGWGSPNGIAAF